MAYDPSEIFREDPGELELTQEYRQQLQVDPDNVEMPDPVAETPDPASTEEESKQPQPQATSTEEAYSGETITFNNGKTYDVEDIEYRNGVPFVKPGANAKYGEGQGNILGQDIGEYAQQVKERTSAVGQGLLDFGVDLLNIIPGVNIPKATKFEDEVAESVRSISAVVTPTLMIGGTGKALGGSAQSRVGWSIGNNKFVQWIGERGIEAGAGAIVGAVSSEYEEDNLTGTLKQSFPKTFDFIPDSIATLETDDADMKRQKNIYEDLGMGFVTDLAIGGVRFVSALAGSKAALRQSDQLVGETDQARRWLESNKPEATEITKARRVWNNAENLDPQFRAEATRTRTPWDELAPDDQAQLLETYRKSGVLEESPEEAVARSVMRQEEALDEVGMYNYSLNPNLDRPLKGVHDMYDYTEVGVRTVDDFGVVGAAIDSARIARNLDTVHGRLGNMISEPALKYALTSTENGQDVVLGLARQLEEAGEIGMVSNNWTVSYADVLDANEDLAIQLFDPRMSKEDLRQVLEPFITRNEAGQEVLMEEGFSLASRALRSYGDELSNMNVARAQSLLAGSLSGRIADLSEGSRLMEGTAAVREAQDKIIDMMQYVTQLSSSAKYYKNRKMGLMRQIANGFKNIEGYNEATVIGAGETARRIFNDSQRFANTMRQIADNQPKLMDQFLMAYELTDGNVDTIVKMNKYIADMTVNVGKGIFDPNPEVQNKLVAGVWSNVYNSMLSGFKTPIAALAGNFGGIISQPIAHFAGALAHGDFKTIQRGFIAYSSINDTLAKAMPYAGELFRKASADPNAVRRETRLDLLLTQEREMEFLREAADTKASEGEMGLQYIVNQIEMLQAFSKDPVLRFGSNALTATDGFTAVFNATAESRFRAMDELAESGLPITKENVKPIADKYYKAMFDKNGILRDDSVKYATDEMALNLDTPLADTISGLVERFPAVRPFLFFPTTGMNAIEMVGKYAPWAPFQRDVNELAFTPLKDLLSNEDHIDDLLRARNINPDEMDSFAKQQRITDLKYTTMGRKAIGTAAVTSAIFLVMNDNITGDGIYDKEVQASREKNSIWQKRSIRGLDGKWYSYEALGPLADWLAMTVNVADNFDMLGEAAVENRLNKLAFVIGASVSDRTALSSMKPLFDIASRNPGSLERWAGGLVNSLGPLASQRGEWNKIFREGMLELDSGFAQTIANRNTFMLTEGANTPYVYSPVTGVKPNGYTFMQRLWNAYSPMKVHSEQSIEEKFLQEMEYDVTSTFRTKNGVKLKPQLRSELFRIMGEQGIFKAAIQDIMRDAGNFETITRLRDIRKQGITSDKVSIDDFDRIHIRLGQAQRVAERAAYGELDPMLLGEIKNAEIEARLRSRASQMGRTLDENLNIRR